MPPQQLIEVQGLPVRHSAEPQLITANAVGHIMTGNRRDSCARGRCHDEGPPRTGFMVFISNFRIALSCGTAAQRELMRMGRVANVIVFAPSRGVVVYFGVDGMRGGTMPLAIC